MRTAWYSFWTLTLLLLLAACGEDEYHYPSVKLEFATVLSGDEGRIQTLIPDEGEAQPVVEDRTGSMIAPKSARRVLSNYETVTGGVRIYSLQSVMTPEPKPATDEAFKEGIKTDPVTMGSIWMGKNFLNMILNLKAGMDAPHVFGMIEDVSALDEKGVVTLLLYHDAGGDRLHYNRKVYLSVPLMKYVNVENPTRPLTVKFTFYTKDEDGQLVLSEKYAEPGFTYVPVLDK